MINGMYENFNPVPSVIALALSLNWTSFVTSISSQYPNNGTVLASVMDFTMAFLTPLTGSVLSFPIGMDMAGITGTGGGLGTDGGCTGIGDTTGVTDNEKYLHL